MGSISDADMLKLRLMVARYAKQIADHLRRETLRLHPELAETAKIFSVPLAGAPTLSNTPAPGAQDGPPESSPGECAAATDAEPVPESDPVAEDETVARVTEALRATPGFRSEELAAVTRISTAFLGPALRQLIDSGWLRRTGAGRGTRYFPR